MNPQNFFLNAHSTRQSKFKLLKRVFIRGILPDFRPGVNPAKIPRKRFLPLIVYHYVL